MLVVYDQYFVQRKSYRLNLSPFGAINVPCSILTQELFYDAWELTMTKDLFSALFFFLMQTAQMMQTTMNRMMANAMMPTINAIRSWNVEPKAHLLIFTLSIINA